MKLNKIGYFFKEGFSSIFTHGFMSFASVTIIMACLIIMGSFTLLAANIDAIISDLEDENQMLAFVDEALTDEEAQALLPEIENIPNVAYAEFVSREQARDTYVSQYDDESIFEDIEATVFRHRYVIYLDDIAKMEETQNALLNITGIARVNAYLEVAEGFVTVRNVVSAVSLVLAAILLVISVFIMANTVKLTSFSRRDEIAVMKMVGASNSFIRWPFMIEGLILGIIGAGLAFVIEWGLYSVVCDKVMASIASDFVQVIPFASVMTPVMIGFGGIGIVVGCFGGVIAIRNYLKV